MMHHAFVQILEGAMLVCFGVSWPVDIVHTLRIKRAAKKSYAFLALILCGYVAGIASKCVRSLGEGQPLEPVIWLYVVNVILVAIDTMLTYHYQSQNSQPR
jgi:lipopolysaccharide export LptBFGC system permease protein LptF